MKKRNSIVVIVALFAVFALAGCSGAVAPAAAAVNMAPTATVAPPPAAIMSSPVVGTVADLESTLEHVYSQVNPSVVTLRTVQKQQVTLPAFPGFSFFGGSQSQTPQYQYQQALGSGFVWDKQGHIITNNHVIDGADQISVVFYDGATVSGTIVGADPTSDLAVLKVDVPANQLQPVQMADSNQVKVGQLAIAIGNPFGEQSTMTVGFVSALGRTLPAGSANSPGPTYSIPDVIQTDAPINPGNSGGVLVDDQGQVFGVTSAIESPVNASSGVGFAIPSAIVQKIVPALIHTGHYDHPYLGISGVTLDPSIAQAMNLPAGQRGALVVDVTKGGPADMGGLHSSDRLVTINGQRVPVGGDVVIAIDGHTINTFDDLVAYLERSAGVGQSITLTVLRDGNQTTLNMTLAHRPSSTSALGSTQVTSADGSWLGLQGVTNPAGGQ